MDLTMNTSIKWVFIIVVILTVCSSVFIVNFIRTDHAPTSPRPTRPRDILECLDLDITAHNPHGSTTPDNAFLGYKLASWLNGDTNTLPKCVTDQNALQVQRINVSKSMTVSDLWHSDLRPVKYGGVYHPAGCSTDDHLAVVIPYRDREKHLTILLNNLHHMLQKQNLSYAIFVVEMALPTQFNRGFLLNMGYLIAKRLGKYNCFVFHDVDSIPMNERNIYKCDNRPVHLASNMTKYPKKGVPYSSYTGGVVMFSGEQFQTINGFSNAYFGWGGEDDDLEIRIKTRNMSVKRVSKSVGCYYSLAHGADSSNPENRNKMELFKSIKTRIKHDGLNSVKFKLFALQFQPLYTRVLVGTNETAVLNSLNIKE